MSTKELAAEIRELVIRPTLAELGERYATEAAVRLLCMTAAHESQFYTLRQRAKWDRGNQRWIHGPARGIYQMEPATYADHLAYLDRLQIAIHTRVFDDFNGFMVDSEGDWLSADRLIGDLYLATAAARLHYWRRPEPLPDAADIHGLAEYAKRHWNTEAGAATVADYRKAYQQFFPDPRDHS